MFAIGVVQGWKRPEKTRRHGTCIASEREKGRVERNSIVYVDVVAKVGGQNKFRRRRDRAWSSRIRIALSQRPATAAAVPRELVSFFCAQRRFFVRGQSESAKNAFFLITRECDLRSATCVRSASYTNHVGQNDPIAQSPNCIIFRCRGGSLAYPSSFHPDDGTPQPAANLRNEDNVSLPRESSSAPRYSTVCSWNTQRIQ